MKLLQQNYFGTTFYAFLFPSNKQEQLEIRSRRMLPLSNLIVHASKENKEIKQNVAVHIVVIPMKIMTLHLACPVSARIGII